MTNQELAKQALNIANNYKTCYMLGAFGHFANDNNITYEVNRKDVNNKPYEEAALQIKNNGFLFDCCGLIKGILWGWKGDVSKTYGGATYQSNNVPDYGADQIIKICKDVSTDFSKVEIGEAVWLSGHIGLYVGDGKVVEATPRWTIQPGVKVSGITSLGYTGDKTRKWTKHGKLPWVEYINEPAPEEIPEYAKDAIAFFTDNEYLKGTGKQLNLSTEMIRVLVIMYRLLKDKGVID